MSTPSAKVNAIAVSTIFYKLWADFNTNFSRNYCQFDLSLSSGFIIEGGSLNSLSTLPLGG